MNGGLIAGRYAKAFYQYTESAGVSQDVYTQVRVLLSVMGKVPKLRGVVSDPRNVPVSEKISLLKSALQNEELRPEIENLLLLMQRHCRTEYFRLALLDYLSLYREDRSILPVLVELPAEDSSLDEIITTNVRKEWGKDALITHKIDPNLIGGFVIKSWNLRLDMSVRTALEKVRKELINDTKRLV